jgi:thiol:disulfide interchange protein DsbD
MLGNRRDSLFRNLPRLLPLAVALLLAMPRLPAAPAAAPPIQVEAVLAQEPAPGRPLRIEFRFQIAPGVHVYAAESHFFKIAGTAAVNLGEMTLELPATKAIPDLLADAPGATVRALEGEATVTVTRPLARTAPGNGWRFAGSLRYQGCTDTACFPPKAIPFDFSGTAAAIPDAPPPAPPGAAAGTGGSWGGHGLLAGAALAFLAGLALSLTPCVYPMLGITVAVIGGRGASRKRTLWLTFWYVLGLALAYAAAGTAIALLGQSVAGFLRSAWVLGPVGILFLLMGLSMFDLFTLATPAALAARLQGIGRQGTAPGVFAMGGLSAFVVGPCMSAPLLGLVTYVATTGEWLRGFLLFFALAWGIGAVLFLAGGATALLPKAGAWMEAVKHALGMVLVWGAFYFTRPLIGETAFLTATLVCLAAGFALIGWLRLPEPAVAESAPRRRRRAGPWLRLALALALLTAATWHVLAGLAADAAAGPAAAGPVDLAAELAAGRPVVLDFTAPWCGNCKVIEKAVLKRPDMQPHLARFNLVKVDFDANPGLVKRYNIAAPPAFLFLDAAGVPEGPAVD